MSLRVDHFRLHYHYYSCSKLTVEGKHATTFQPTPRLTPKDWTHTKIWKSKVKFFLSIRADQVQRHSPSARMVHLDKNLHHSTCNRPTPRFRSKDPTRTTIGENLMWQTFCPVGQAMFTDICLFQGDSSGKYFHYSIHNPRIQTHPQTPDKVKLFTKGSLSYLSSPRLAKMN